MKDDSNYVSSKQYFPFVFCPSCLWESGAGLREGSFCWWEGSWSWCRQALGDCPLESDTLWLPELTNMQGCCLHTHETPHMPTYGGKSGADDSSVSITHAQDRSWWISLFVWCSPTSCYFHAVSIKKDVEKERKMLIYLRNHTISKCESLVQVGSYRSQEGK